MRTSYYYSIDSLLSSSLSFWCMIAALLSGFLMKIMLVLELILLVLSIIFIPQPAWLIAAWGIGIILTLFVARILVRWFARRTPECHFLREQPHFAQRLYERIQGYGYAYALELEELQRIVSQ